MEETADSTVSGVELFKFLGPPVNSGEEVTPSHDGYPHQEMDLTSIDFEGLNSGTFLPGPMGPQAQDALPHSSQGVPLEWVPMSDLEEPDYLIKAGGAPNTEKHEEYQKLSEYKFDMNLREIDESEWRKSPSEIYSKKLNMFLVTPSDGINKSKKLIFWTAKEVRGGRVRIVMLRKDKAEKHKPVTLCPAHQQWSPSVHYILADSQPNSDCGQIQYLIQEGHPVLVVPLEQSYEDKNVKTGEDGYSYPREFLFPCNAFHLKQDSFTLVAGLEVPTQSNPSVYRCVGITTVDVRVCGSPGRDKDKREGKPASSLAIKKEGTSRKRSARDSTDTDATDGGSPVPKQKKVQVERSTGEVGCTHNTNPLTPEVTGGLSSGTYPSSSAVSAAPVPTGGVASEEGSTSTVAPVAMEMAMPSTNSDLFGKLNELDCEPKTYVQVQVFSSKLHRAIIAKGIDCLTAAEKLRQEIKSLYQSELHAARATIGGDSHSHA